MFTSAASLKSGGSGSRALKTLCPAPGVLEVLALADLVFFCPSNPWVSIGPILAVPGIKEAIQRHPTVAISPIIGGKTVKGPAAKMYAELESCLRLKQWPANTVSF